MSNIRLILKLGVRAPFLFKSGASLPLGLDAATMVADDGSPLLPGTHLRGHIRHAWKEFAALAGADLDTAFIDDWLGNESINNSHDEPKRGRLHFDAYWRAAEGATLLDLPRGTWLSPPAVHTARASAAPVRFRVRIDDKTGTADPGALQLIGQTHAAGTCVNFTGGIDAGPLSIDQEKKLMRYLTRALEWTPALGALKGIGFGVIEKLSVDPVTFKPDSLPLEAEFGGSRRTLAFTLDRPYCFGARVIENNRFESGACVPGGAIRGALFAWCKRAQSASQEPDKSAASTILGLADHIHVCHAWPCSSEGRVPMVVPQSALAVSKIFLDASDAHYAAPFLVRGQNGHPNEIPKFPNDWKEQSGAFASEHQWASLVPWIEVRTAIDATTGSAFEEKLFSLDCFLPGENDRAHTFRSQILLNGDANTHAELWKCLSRALPMALHHLGKTEARAENLSWSAVPPIDSKPKTDETDRIVITLAADALLCQFDDNAEIGKEDALLAAYRTHFDDLSSKSLELVDVFADQRLVGGTYFRNRFWHADNAYHPRVLTLAGSVFVFKVINALLAAEKVASWLACGLPTSGPPNWEVNPYLPANGFGEIRLGTGIITGNIAATRRVQINQNAPAREAAR